MNLNHNKFILFPKIEIIFHFELQKDSDFQKMEESGGIPLNPCRARLHHGDVIIGNVPRQPLFPQTVWTVEISGRCFL
jgi:hypothetical protein